MGDPRRGGADDSVDSGPRILMMESETVSFSPVKEFAR